MLKLGYACINTVLREQGIYASRTITLGSIDKKGFEAIKDLVIKNLSDLKTIIQWNEDHGIRFFRLTSGLFPHCDNPLLLSKYKDYTMSFAEKELREVGDLIKKYGHRVTMHPGQYVQLGSVSQKVVDNSILTLTYHANVLLGMGLSLETGSGMVIHGGGTYGNKSEAIDRLERTIKSLPKEVRELIILENDEWSYGVDDLLPLSERVGVPFCLDIFHNKISNNKVPITMRLLKRIYKTWKYYPPKMHYSEQDPSLRKGSHSKFVMSLPKWLLKIPKKLGDLCLMLEVKDKEQSVLRILDKYFDKSEDRSRVVWRIKKAYIGV